MIQKILAAQNPLLVDMIPHGSINSLAQIHNLSRQTISNILRGDPKYSEETITKVMKSAIELITEDTTEKTDYVNKLRAVITA